MTAWLVIKKSGGAETTYRRHIGLDPRRMAMLLNLVVTVSRIARNSERKTLIVLFGASAAMDAGQARNDA